MSDKPKYLFENEAQLQQIISSHINHGTIIDFQNPFQEINERIERKRNAILGSEVIHPGRWGKFYSYSLTYSWAMLGQLKSPINLSVLVSKHQTYGARPILKWGHVGILYRIDTKVGRVMNMTRMDDQARNKLQKEVLDESISDTYFDLFGYSILGLILVNMEY